MKENCPFYEQFISEEQFFLFIYPHWINKSNLFHLEIIYPKEKLKNWEKNLSNLIFLP